MKSIQKSLIPIVAVTATAVLLLAGCQQGNHGKDKMPSVEQTEATVDTTEEDTMAAFYERMQRWKALHGWTDRWKSEK
jgi:outer membrane murein-binding lipoprotein Lpp